MSVGLQLRLDQLKGNRAPLGLGLGFRLVLRPLLIALVFFGALSWNGEVSRVTIFEAAMGPQIGGANVAMQYGLSPSLITLMVGVWIALSFLTLPLRYLGLALPEIFIMTGRLRPIPCEAEGMPGQHDGPMFALRRSSWDAEDGAFL